MKSAQLFVAVVALFACFGASVAAKPVTERKNDLLVVKKVEPLGEGALCSLCDQFVSQGINQVLNIILNLGVVGGCSTVCTKALENEPQWMTTVCSLACDVLGIKGFMALLDKFGKDIDPIYFCEVVKMCPVHDGGAARVDSVSVNPPSGPQGTTFDIEVLFTVMNQTSTGIVDVAIQCADGLVLGSDQLSTGLAPGNYKAQFQLQANPQAPSESGEPTEQFIPGDYNVAFTLCAGDCGSTYPHSGVYDSGSGSFSITA
uniref:Saposin B-type domain-containing protein n=1 Tax=Palpitomonas bilix TaxID=652834 RepID=A0A7S3CWR4_9EUKA|mmetsp:Transcript_12426/g.33268  ORF Transcript_12426/g.33268 Transcript_12426/m.33268 type:complete len:259 (+) Transcript_12426:126-902(+)